MYAVIETGGKQYRVELGSEIQIDRLDVTPGETIELGRVLLVADGDAASIGQPVVDGARVSASVVRQDRGEKLVVFKYRPKARRRVKHGHRQDLTIVRVADIEFDGRSAAREAEEASREQERARAAAAEQAERQAAADRALADRLAREQAEAQAAEPATEAKPAKRAGRSRAARAVADESGASAGAAPETGDDAPQSAQETPDNDTPDNESSEGTAAPKPRRSTKKDE